MIEFNREQYTVTYVRGTEDELKLIARYCQLDWDADKKHWYIVGDEKIAHQICDIRNTSQLEFISLLCDGQKLIQAYRLINEYNSMIDSNSMYVERLDKFIELSTILKTESCSLKNHGITSVGIDRVLKVVASAGTKIDVSLSEIFTLEKIESRV